jgi:diguanylate cyclase (GGDEF)-like protein
MFLKHFATLEEEVLFLRQENARLLAENIIDPLTGLYNLRGLDQKSKELFDRPQLLLSTLMIDLDLFKQTNDTYGHHCGNLAIKKLAGVLSNETRITDTLAFRVGGDEFLMLVPRISLLDAVGIAERIRFRMSAAPITYKTKSFYQTASIGVAQYTDGMSFEELKDLADQRLYTAKAKHDSVCWQDPEPENILRMESPNTLYMPNFRKQPERIAVGVG